MDSDSDSEININQNAIVLEDSEDIPFEENAIVMSNDQVQLEERKKKEPKKKRNPVHESSIHSIIISDLNYDVVTTCKKNKFIPLLKKNNSKN